MSNRNQVAINALREREESRKIRQSYGVGLSEKASPDIDPAQTRNDVVVCCFIPNATLKPFLSSFARAVCAPLRNDVAGYQACVLSNSHTNQGREVYDADGSVVGKSVFMRANFHRANVIGIEARHYGEVFLDREGFDAFMDRNGYNLGVDDAAEED